MRNWFIPTFGLLIFIAIAYSFFSSLLANPVLFIIIFGLGMILIIYLFYSGEGVFNPSSEGYPPYGKLIGILITCFVIFMLFTINETELNDCPIAVSRYC